MSAGEKRFDPRDKLGGPKAPRRLGRGVILLRDDDVAGRVNVETELDRGAQKATAGSGGPGRDRPNAMMMNILFHTKSMLTSSPAAFHAIYALQRL